MHRPRALAALQAAGDGQVVWLVAAGGYGKTTLARDCARRGGRCLVELTVPESGWTTGEQFRLLRTRALAALGNSALEPPVYTPAHTGSPLDFGRRLAETLGPAMGEAFTVFVDDLQNLEPGEAADLLPAMLEILAAHGVQVIVASRSEPSPAWAAVRGRGRLHVLDESLLAFTADEVATLLGCDGVDDRVRALHERTGGWAAGLKLALEQWQRHGPALPESRLQGSLDDWFATEVTGHMGSADLALLRSCAVPGRFPMACAAAGTGMADAAERLHRLVSEHAFVDLEETADGPQVRLHDLFREHLRRQLSRDGGVPDVRALTAHWGRELWEWGDWSIGARLLVEAHDLDTLATGLKSAAPVLIQDGRRENLLAWLEEIPMATRRADPELTLWEGVSLILHDSTQARMLLMDAWEGLEPRRMYDRMAIAWTGIIDSAWMEKQHVAFYDPWIDAFHRHEAAFREQLPQHLWFAALRGMVAALGHGRPHDPVFARWEREALSTLAGEMPDDERLMLAGQLMFVYTWQLGRRAGAERVMGLMRENPQAQERASPLPRSVWLTFTSLYALFFQADGEASERDALRARELVLQYGLRSWECGVPPLQAAICFEDPGLLRQWLPWFLRGECRAHKAFYDTFHAHFLACEAWLNGDAHAAVSHARDSLVAVEDQGAPVLSAGFRAVLAGCLADTGAHAGALREAAAARRARAGFPSAFLDLLVYTPLARIPLARGQPQRALPYLRRLFASGAREYLFFPFLIRRRELAALCGLALQGGIETDYVRWLIAKADLAPPPDPGLRLAWPWPVRLHTLGGLYVERRDDASATQPFSSQGQVALVSSLVAAGPKGLDRDALARRLWPQSRRDRAMNSLNVACHRLREQLGDPGAVLVEGGRVAFASGRVWVDAWEVVALARGCQAYDRHILAEAVACCQGAPELMGADELESDFIATEVGNAHQELAEALAVRLEQEDPREALRFCLDALAQANLNETLWSIALRCAARVGSGGALERVAGQMHQAFATLLDEPPPDALLGELEEARRPRSN